MHVLMIRMIILLALINCVFNFKIAHRLLSKSTLQNLKLPVRPRITTSLKGRQLTWAMDESVELDLVDFERVVEAVQVFGKVYGDFKISYKFDVPANDQWPKHLHHLRLGRKLQRILLSDDFFAKHGEKVEMLKATGFEPSFNSLIDEWDVLFEAMKCYKSIYGNIRIPHKFVVPDGDPWPRLCRNVKLGVRVAGTLATHFNIIVSLFFPPQP